MEKAKVYFTKDISPQGLVRVFDALQRNLKGKVAVKISTGEPGGHNFLQPILIKDLVNKLNGTIVENCTAYRGRRFDAKEHWQTIKEHGFFDIAPCDILDEDGEEEEYKLVSSVESDPFNNKISVESPIGSAIKGHKSGDKVLVESPNGGYNITIVKVA